ncbi:CDT1-like protein a, chloroplastic [Selaginella moellendorffii]|nr:CDT1-like protein a, chloroplastic [Selaginella moellendorffii]|eukprot:XP_002961773.2 CDT1-like protein a, chloroplastic [Selaginella moellendorffii]
MVVHTPRYSLPWNIQPRTLKNFRAEWKNVNVGALSRVFRELAMEQRVRRNLLGGSSMVLGKEMGSPEKKLKKSAPASKRALEEFFEALESTVALLKIRKQSCTFAAVSAPVEALTKRRFLRSHLAKIKYLFPEAVECDSFTWKDPDTSSLKTDIRIKLLPFSPEQPASVSKSVSGMARKWSADTVARRREFQKRIAAFEKDDEVPEAQLVEEVTKIKVPDLDTGAAPIPNVLAGKVVIKSGYEDIVERRLQSDDAITTSHFSPSFRRHFSARQRKVESSELQQASPEPETPQTCKVAPRATTGAFTGPDSTSRLYASADTLPKIDHDAPTPPRRQSVVKSLQFGSAEKKKILESIPNDLLHSVHEKEQKELEEKSIDKRRQQMLSGLPHFLNMTRLIFQSLGRSTMLHKDLVEQIESSATEITDKNEIEERLQLLLELAPEWISSRASLVGGTLYRVQKTAEFSTIRKRMLDAA